MDKLLYFPYISIPNTAWTMQSLIYWDEMATIVPIEFTRRPDDLDPFTQMLIREELLKQIHPEDHVFSIKDFDTNFMDYVIREVDEKKIFQSQDRNYFYNNRKSYQKIHMGKLQGIGDGLVELGLAYKEEHWYYVKKYFAKAFMTYLAILLAERTDYVATTDRFNGFSSFFDQYDHNPYKVFTKTRTELRTQILNDILPIPKIDDYYDLLRFKNRYHSQLTRFRNYIEESILNILESPADQIVERKQRFLQQARIDLNEIKTSMNRFGFYDIAVGSMAAAPTVFSLCHGTSGITAYLASGAGLLGTILSTVNTNRTGKEMNKPLAYAAILTKTFN